MKQTMSTLKCALWGIIIGMFTIGSFCSCSDDETSLNSYEERLVGVYLRFANDVTCGYIELSSDKTGTYWEEINNSSDLPVSKKEKFTWSATGTHITINGGIYDGVSKYEWLDNTTLYIEFDNSSFGHWSLR